ncbi:MAG: BON domain-containing protein [Proteobacteria bacterium]|nr:BON domain-containing protein [Pseudomonadota bacterium]
MKDMKANWKLLVLLPAFLALQGCVVVIGTDAEDGVYFAGESREEGGIRHDGDSLSKHVARAIAGDADLVAEDLRVSSEDGVVVLRGRVHSVQLLEKALAAARDVEGVERVVSKMTVDAG